MRELTADLFISVDGFASGEKEAALTRDSSSWSTALCAREERALLGAPSTGGIQGDGKHSHLERRHDRELRACRRNPNRKCISIRPGGPA